VLSGLLAGLALRDLHPATPALCAEAGPVRHGKYDQIKETGACSDSAGSEHAL